MTTLSNRMMKKIEQYLNWLHAGPPVALLEIDDAATSLHVSFNLVRDFAKSAAKHSSELRSVDATDARTWLLPRLS